MKNIIAFLFFIILFSSCSRQQPATGTFKNPVIRGDLADPSIIRIGEDYYAMGTSSEWAPIYPIFQSKDLVNWNRVGQVFNKKPEWTSQSFWAPELYYHQNKVFCYYTARRAEDGVSYIGVASAASPMEEFTDHGLLVEYGTEAIDAFIYDDNGQLYISWKAYGLDERPIELLASKLSADGLRLEGEPFSLLKDDENIGMEGQYHFKQGEYYYIIYCARSCCGPGSDYDVRVARAKSYEGPYEKYSGNPILAGKGADFMSCGHGTAVETPDGRMFYMCHAYLPGPGFYAGRQPIIQEMEVADDQWVRFKTGDTARIEQSMPFAGVKQNPLENMEDSFESEILNRDWSWNYPYSDVEVKVGKGKLLLSGTPIGDNCYGTALCLRAQTSDYTYETQVMVKNEGFQGLTLYGDNKNLILWGISGDKFVLKSVKENEESMLYTSDCNEETPYLKVAVEKGCMLTFYRSKEGHEWEAVLTAPVDAAFTVRWDRVSRPGLLHIGAPEQPAEFSYFKLINV